MLNIKTKRNSLTCCLGAVIVFIILFLVGCTPYTPEPAGVPRQPKLSEMAHNPRIQSKTEREKKLSEELGETKVEEETLSEKEAPAPEPEVLAQGRGRRPPGAPPYVEEVNRRGRARRKPISQEPRVHVELAFDNADIYEVLDATLYELFKVNYVMDPTIRAKISFHFSGDYTRDEFINVMNNVLQLNNLAIVHGPGDIFKVVRKNMSAGSINAPPLKRGADAHLGDITRMIRLRYVSASAMVKTIKPFMSKGAVIAPDSVTNSLIITDTPANIDKALSILAALDVPYFSDINWRLFSLKEVDASEMAKDLDKVLKAGGLFNRPGIDKGSIHILPLKTINALLVVTKWPSMLTLVERWIHAMDQADESGTSVFVYFVENGSAVEIADILKQLYGASGRKRSKKVTLVGPKGKKVQKVTSGELMGEVEIIPDETNNAIVFKATRRDYKIIKNVLKQLDIIPRQVLIDVVIAEVTLEGSVEYGIEWYLKGHMGDYTSEAVLDSAIPRKIGTPLGTTTGFIYSVFDAFDFLRGLIHALGKDASLNILSSPNILAVDNKEATIEVGEEIPLVTGKVTDATSGTTVTSTIQYRKTGIILKVTPHINSTGLIKMELTQEVSNKGTYDQALNTYSILNRRAETSLVVENGQTILIGGLMRTSRSESGSGIPFLRRIPILGYLFGGRKVETKKTELIILITPHVIQNRAEADLITEEFTKRVKELQDIIKLRRVE